MNAFENLTFIPRINTDNNPVLSTLQDKFRLIESQLSFLPGGSMAADAFFLDNRRYQIAIQNGGFEVGRKKFFFPFRAKPSCDRGWLQIISGLRKSAACMAGQCYQDGQSHHEY